MILSDLLEALLDKASTWVTTPRAFISHALPPMDCDSLVVWTDTINATAPNKGVCSVVSKWTVHVSRYKCVPTMDNDGNALPASEYQDSALDLAEEGASIWYGVIDAWSDGSLFDGLIGCEAIDFTQGMRALVPQGGIGGWDLTIIVSLP